MSVKKNYLYSLAYQILVIITPLITTPYISRVLGKDGIGAYGYTQSVCIYFTLIASLGIALYGQREISSHRDSIEERSRIFIELILLRAGSVLVSLVFYYLLFVRQNRYSELFLIQSLDVFAVILDISWMLQGMEDFKRVVTRNAIVKCISIACIFIFVKTAKDLGIYALCLSGASFLGNLSLWIYVPKYICWIKPEKLRPMKHLSATLPLFLPQIAIQVYNVMDKTMLGTLCSEIAQTGFYTQAQKITKVSLAVITSMGSVMLPHVSYIFAKGKQKELEEAIFNSFRFALFMGCGMMFGLIAVAKGMVPWFYGAGYEPVIGILYALSPTILFIALSNVSGIQCLVPMKQNRAFNISVMAGAGCNLLFNGLMIPRYGALGACIGTVAAEGTVLIVQLLYVRKIIRLQRLLPVIAKDLAAGFIMLLILLFLQKSLPVHMISSFVECGIGILVYIVLLKLLWKEKVYE